MAITQAMANVYKRDVHDGKHLPGHEYRIALYVAAATLDATTAAYSATNEVVGTGYTATGLVLTGRAVSLNTGVGCLDFTDAVWAASTITARGALIYNNTLAGKDVIAILDFGADITSTAGNFTVDFPAVGAATSLIRFA